MTNNQLQPHEYHNFYQPYVNKSNHLNLQNGFKENHQTVIDFLKNIPESKLEYRYEAGKWTIKEVILHLIDTERIFAYRALRIARNDQTALPGFDQDEYVPESRANERSREDLLQEYTDVRNATISLFKSFDDSSLQNIGLASNHKLSVRAAGFIIMGHENHHCEVIKAKYL